MRNEVILKDGWHKVGGCDVYVEDGYCVRGYGRYIYKACKTGGWDRVDAVKPDTLRQGFKKGTYTLK